MKKKKINTNGVISPHKNYLKDLEAKKNQEREEKRQILLEEEAK